MFSKSGRNLASLLALVWITGMAITSGLSQADPPATAPSARIWKPDPKLLSKLTLTQEFGGYAILAPADFTAAQGGRNDKLWRSNKVQGSINSVTIRVQPQKRFIRDKGVESLPNAVPGLAEQVGGLLGSREFGTVGDFNVVRVQFDEMADTVIEYGWFDGPNLVEVVANFDKGDARGATLLESSILTVHRIATTQPSGAAPTTQPVWLPDAKLVAKLTVKTTLGGYTILAPTGYTVVASNERALKLKGIGAANSSPYLGLIVALRHDRNADYPVIFTDPHITSGSNDCFFSPNGVVDYGIYAGHKAIRATRHETVQYIQYAWYDGDKFILAYETFPTATSAVNKALLDAAVLSVRGPLEILLPPAATQPAR